MSYAVRIYDLTGGLGPNEKSGMLQTTQGRFEVYAHDSQIQDVGEDTYIKVHPVTISGEQAIVELTREAVNGVWRVRIPARELIGIID